MRQYTIVMTSDPEGGGYNVTVPALDGCFTYGSTVEEAIQYAQDAIRLHIEALAANGLEIPEDVPSSLAVVQVPDVVTTAIGIS